ncbi:MAG: hypothetical protein Q8R60_12125 [Mycobacteriales bacterium]|nr:hypothetical protein [Mycobacteriales bacterium]
MTSATADGWEAATFEGAVTAQRLALAALTPQERLAWLDDAVHAVAAQGALSALRERERRCALEAWAATDPDRVS